MRWTRGYQSDDVELRGSSARGMPIGLLGSVFSRFGLGGAVLVAGIYFASQYLGGGSQPAQERSDEGVQFVSFVLDDAQKTWTELFRERGLNYRNARLVIYRNQTKTGCGFGSAAAGPFYCPLDQTVYIDLSFYDELKRQFGAPGDFAQAYVIAHEIGHHVQNQLDLLSNSGRTGEDSQSVKQELQADCLAGVWGHSAEARNLLEVGDVDEALRAAAAIGDDALQRRSEGVVRPESWTHGSSEQRTHAFNAGYRGGRLDDCGVSNSRR